MKAISFICPSVGQTRLSLPTLDNAVWYYTMLVGHFLLETFKEDVAASVISIGAYANTVLRKLIDP
jgi:hypothetical protein|tara:strand:- start:9238 stop:9435 length:198 start_codon:yes stop_codon:yes gene_type:complete